MRRQKQSHGTWPRSHWKVVAVGEDETSWKVGDRAGGAWHGGHDGELHNILVLGEGSVM